MVVYGFAVRLVHLQRRNPACTTSCSLVRGRCSSTSALYFTTTCSASLSGLGDSSSAPAVPGVSNTNVSYSGLCPLKTKAFFEASCHGVVFGSSWLVVDPRVSLSSLRDSLQNGRRSLSSIFSD